MFETVNSTPGDDSPLAQEKGDLIGTNKKNAQQEGREYKALSTLS